MRDLCGNNILKKMMIASVFTQTWLKSKLIRGTMKRIDKLKHRRLPIKKQRLLNFNKHKRQRNKLRSQFQFQPKLLKLSHKLLSQRTRRKSRCSKSLITPKTIRKMIKQLKASVN